MSDSRSCDVMDWAEFASQHVVLLPARTVLSGFGAGHTHEPGVDGDSGHGVAGTGESGDAAGGNTGGDAVGGDGGDAYAVIIGNENYGFMQVNIAVAVAGPGGDAYAGHVHADIVEDGGVGQQAP